MSSQILFWKTQCKCFSCQTWLPAWFAIFPGLELLSSLASCDGRTVPENRDGLHRSIVNSTHRFEWLSNIPAAGPDTGPHSFRMQCESGYSQMRNITTLQYCTPVLQVYGLMWLMQSDIRQEKYFKELFHAQTSGSISDVALSVCFRPDKALVGRRYCVFYTQDTWTLGWDNPCNVVPYDHVRKVNAWCACFMFLRWHQRQTSSSVDNKVFVFVKSKGWNTPKINSSILKLHFLLQLKTVMAK